MTILIVCNHNCSDYIVQNCAQMANLLYKQNINVEILTSNNNENYFTKHCQKANIHTTKLSKYNWLSSYRLQKSLKTILNENEKIEIVYFADLTNKLKCMLTSCKNLGVICIAQANNAKFLTKKICKKLQTVVVQKQHLLETAITNELTNIALIPEGIDTMLFKQITSKQPIRKKLNLPAKTTIICCHASFAEKNKQIEALISTMPLAEHLHMLFIGRVEEPDYLQKLEDKIVSLNVKDYTHIITSEEHLVEYLECSDIFINLGNIEENRTNILQAKSCALPVVLAPSISSLYLTGANRSGVVLYPQNMLARKAYEKMITESNYRQNRSMHARPFVTKNHNIKTTYKQLGQLFESI